MAADRIFTPSYRVRKCKLKGTTLAKTHSSKDLSSSRGPACNLAKSPGPKGRDDFVSQGFLTVQQLCHLFGAIHSL